MVIPTAFFYGGNDSLSNKTDVGVLIPEITNLKYNEYIQEYNHIDFVFGIDSPKVLYNRILDIMDEILVVEHWSISQRGTRNLTISPLNRSRFKLNKSVSVERLPCSMKILRDLIFADFVDCPRSAKISSRRKKYPQNKTLQKWTHFSQTQNSAFNRPVPLGRYTLEKETRA